MPKHRLEFAFKQDGCWFYRCIAPFCGKIMCDGHENLDEECRTIQMELPYEGDI